MLWQITGNLGKDGPNMRYTPKGTAVANMSVAENYKGRNGQEQTTWRRVTAWEDLAERLNQEFEKGSFLRLEGYSDPKINEWTDREGAPRLDLEYTAQKAYRYDHDTKKFVDIMESQSRQGQQRSTSSRRRSGPAAPPRRRQQAPPPMPEGDVLDW